MIRHTHCAPLERGDWTHHDSIDIARISIALLIQSLDPLECKRWKSLPSSLLKELFRQG